MLFGYECEKCNKRFDADYPIGKAPRTAPCPSCKGSGKRVYAGMSIAVKINGHTSLSTGFGEQLKRKNADANRRMRMNRTAPKLLGYQHADGSTKEA